MKQVLQSLRTGATEVADVPAPRARRRDVLVRTHRTLVSVGTERMLVDFGRAGFIDKARQQPEKVRMVLDKVRTDGLLPTVEAVRNKLDQPLAMGYCNVGRVLEAGMETDFRKGERVVSNGKHAEVVCVPMNLCARIPDGVSDDAASFTVLGAIALQGIRLVAPALGESVAVIGLGLIGILTVQLLRAQGCRVLGIDIDPAKLELARSFGAECVLASGDAVGAGMAFSRDRGMDAVVITASTASDEPVQQAARMSRKRGRIVLVGVAGLQLARSDFYEKELSFQVSCSYGPGRYDKSYEQDGVDYPVGFVRWTEQRNFEAVLDMMADGRLEVESLISHRFTIDEAADAYDIVAQGAPSLGIVLEYPESESSTEESVRRTTVRLAAERGVAVGTPCLGFIGSGSYAGSVLIPAFERTRAVLRSVASSGGVSGLHVGRKHGFEQTTTDAEQIFADPAIHAVVITTRHDTHCELVLRALGAGKHVFVEKPLCLRLDELRSIEEAHAAAGKMLMVGFNRRFAPHVVETQRLLGQVSGPKSFLMTVNAGHIPGDHWVHDPHAGGGRIVGEACHFIDLLRFLARSPIASHRISRMKTASEDVASISLEFDDGSLGVVNYFANGSKSFPKERLEVFASGGILQIDNFRRLNAYGWKGAGAMRLWRQDKGNAACAQAFVHALETGGPSPISFAETAEVSRIAIEVASHG